MQDLETNEKIAYSKRSYKLHGKAEPYECFFEEPAALVPNRRYSVSMTSNDINRKEEVASGVTSSYWGCGGQTTITQGNVTFTFSMRHSPGTFTFGPSAEIDRGRIQEILFHL